MSSSGHGSSHPPHPHVALLPSAGIGHLTPFLRFAVSLISQQCQVTLITTHPIVSLAESELISTFLAAFPEEQFHLLPFDPTTASSTDPFALKWESIRRSAHLLYPLLASLSPPLSALVSDVSLISSVVAVTETLTLPNYILFPSSARMFSFFAYYPTLLSKIAGSDHFDSCDEVLQVPGGKPIPKSSLPPPLLDPSSLFSSIFTEDSKKLGKLDGILINTFEELEPDSLHDLRAEKAQGLPKVFTVGLKACEFERSSSSNTATLMKWLDGHLTGTVVFFCFGSRSAMTREQIREIGKGLLASGSPFLWKVKDNILDKEDAESLDVVLGDELWERINEKGMVVKEWVCQAEILGHRAVGGFVSHCGWNSITEAVWHGVPLLAWPISAEVVDKRGFGVWPKTWGWAGGVMVKGEEIGSRIKEMMGSESVKQKAAMLREEARKAIGAGGCCENALMELIGAWKI
ncbi:hypothetical protein Tsubulata_008836 [Turnera subulata]|uniref:anthocyanidin 3-O-glucosyltransferase n=1 Tax=Turnera subulata TaxID=218843 RepID=A0A9Q0F9Z5_9ROSI|nr:hypothetical protein Tsubulata_008836 [Turnera subulata]